jgi:hypothetical protein
MKKVLFLAFLLLALIVSNMGFFPGNNVTRPTFDYK